MSINIKKYTKEQMAQMVEEAQCAQKEAEATAARHFEDGVKLAEENEKLRGQIGELTARLENVGKELDKVRAQYKAADQSAAALKAQNTALTEDINQMNGEAVNRANEIANLKAKVQDFRGKLADTETALGRANAELGAAEGALGKMNDKIVRCEEYSRSLRGDVNKLQLEKIDAIMRADYAEAHPWRNLWAWVRHKA